MFHLGNTQRQCVPREEEQSMMGRGKTGCCLTLSLSPSFPVSPVLSCWPLSHAKLWLSGQGCSVVTYAPQLASSQTGDFTRHLPLPPRKGVTSPGTHDSHICSQGCLGQHQRGPEWLLVGFQPQIWHLRCPYTRFLTKPLSIEKGDSWVGFFPELDDSHWKARKREENSTLYFSVSTSILMSLLSLCFPIRGPHSLTDHPGLLHPEDQHPQYHGKRI